MVTSGSTCTRVTSKEECEDAARQLGLADTEAGEETVSDWPPYCYFYDHGNRQELYFNKDGNAISECNSDGKICICKNESGEMDVHCQ